MRVTDLQRNRSYGNQIQERLSNLNRIQQEMGTGRSLFAPSENVTHADQALRAEADIAAGAQYLRNIDDGMGWVDSADAKLQSIVDLLNDVDALALAANNSSQTADDRRASAIELNAKLEDLMSLVNATHGDRYLFGGFATTTSPFAATRDAAGHIVSVAANEDTIAGRIYRSIGQDESVQINIPGSQLFQPVGQEGTDSDLFSVIAKLRDTVANDNTPPVGFEATQSNEHLRDQLKLIRERIIDQQTSLGSVGQRLELSKTRLKDREIQATDRLEQAQGVDITDLVTRAATEEGAYNALATLGSRLLRQTLVDYLG